MRSRGIKSANDLTKNRFFANMVKFSNFMTNSASEIPAELKM